MKEQMTTTRSTERGNAHVDVAMANVTTKPIGEQHESRTDSEKLSTGADFAASARYLEESLRANPNAEFDPEVWLNNPSSHTDHGVYARILDRVQAGDEPLRDYELVALRYMQGQTALNRSEALVHKEALGDNRDTILREKLADYKAKLTAAAGTPDEAKLRLSVDALEDSLASGPAVTGTELADFIAIAESNYANSDQRSKDSSPFQKSLDAVYAADKHTQYTIITNQILAEAYPLVPKETPNLPAVIDKTDPAYARQSGSAEASPQAAPEKPESPELTEACAALDKLRSELGALNARREKRLWGIDGGMKEANYSFKTKQLYADYQAASRHVFELTHAGFLRNDGESNESKILKIAEYTVSEARKLDESTLDSYKNSHSRFGRMLERYGNMSGTKKLLIGVGAAALAGIFTGGAGTAAVSGSLMAASFEARHRKNRGNGGDMLKLDATKLVKHYTESGIDLTAGGEKAMSGYEAVMHGAQFAAKNAFEQRIDKQQAKRVRRVLGSYAAGATIGLVTHNLPGGLVDGWNSAYDQTVQAIPGAENAADAAGAADPGGGIDVQAPEAPLPGVEAIVGPSNVYVSPGDGFYDVFSQMNVPEHQWNSILEKAGPELIQSGDAYYMPDGGIGITSPGQLSQHALEAIQSARW